MTYCIENEKETAMVQQSCPMTSKKILDTYFIENRARILEIASFLDRIDRTKDSRSGKTDFRYKAFIKALELLLASAEKRTRAIQLSLSDLSAEPIESAFGLTAVGASEGGYYEGD